VLVYEMGEQHGNLFSRAGGAQVRESVPS
jgi:hypothetical protein